MDQDKIDRLGKLLEANHIAELAAEALHLKKAPPLDNKVFPSDFDRIVAESVSK